MAGEPVVLLVLATVGIDAAVLTPLFCEVTTTLLGAGPPKLAIRFRLAPLVGENCSEVDDPDGEATETGIYNRLKLELFKCIIMIIIIIFEISTTQTAIKINNIIIITIGTPPILQTKATCLTSSLQFFTRYSLYSWMNNR